MSLQSDPAVEMVFPLIFAVLALKIVAASFGRVTPNPKTTFSSPVPESTGVFPNAAAVFSLAALVFSLHAAHILIGEEGCVHAYGCVYLY